VLAADAVTYVQTIEAELKKRYDALVAGDEQILDRTELLVLLLDNQDAIQAISSDSKTVAAYKNIIGKYKNMNVCILAVVDNAPVSYNSPEILKNIRDQRHLMFFDDLGNLKLFDMPFPVVRNFKKPIEKGDSYYIKETECTKLKTNSSVFVTFSTHPIFKLLTENNINVAECVVQFLAFIEVL
jgi:S-DNA-T family DNA segregation ATPase FtsK/SpoIIIE